jgi:Family of unknown function (DUF6064)
MESANLPFTRDQFLGMFEVYNQAIWPAQVLAYLLGLAAVVFLLTRARASSRAVAAILAAFWLWIGVAFLLIAMRTIDGGPGPLVFGAAFLLQAGLWLLAGVIRQDLRFEPKLTSVSAVGWALIGYALVVYPLLGLVAGHVYPRQPMFGVAPCPTVIFSFGLLLLTEPPVSKYLLVVPLVWAVTSGLSAPLNFGIYEDLGLVTAGVVGTALLIWRDRRVPARRRALQPHHV